VFSLVALLFAAGAGLVIPLSGGRLPVDGALRWTPHATGQVEVQAAGSTPTATPWLTPTAASTATVVPSPTATPTCAASPTLAPTATATAVPQARIPEGPVNLRAGPGIGFAVLGVAKDGESFTILGRSEDSRWVQLCCIADKAVWASVDYAELPAPVDSYPFVR
jgi:hypothetical protein